MINFLYFLLGLVLLFFDISILPALTSYLLFSDILLFYFFSLYDSKKVGAIPLYIFLLFLRCIFIPGEILIQYIVLQLSAFLFFIWFYHTIRIPRFLMIGIPGFLFLIIECFLMKKASFPSILAILGIQFLFWLILSPLIKILNFYYEEKIKNKGVFV